MTCCYFTQAAAKDDVSLKTQEWLVAEMLILLNRHLQIIGLKVAVEYSVSSLPQIYCLKVFLLPAGPPLCYL